MPRLKYTGPSNEDIGTGAIPLPEGWPMEAVDVSDELAKEMLASGMYERVDGRRRATGDVVIPEGAEANLETEANE